MRSLWPTEAKAPNHWFDVETHVGEGSKQPAVFGLLESTIRGSEEAHQVMRAETNAICALHSLRVDAQLP